MGYNTDFDGHLDITPALKPEHLAYLKKFSYVRHMKRNPDLIQTPDPLREAVGLPLGIEGEFYVGSIADFVQDMKALDVVDPNAEPRSQPGLWCNWDPSDQGSILEIEGEKCYAYLEWLTYLIDNFFIPWGYSLNGNVRWRGEEFDDMGTIAVLNNVVATRKASF